MSGEGWIAIIGIGKECEMSEPFTLTPQSFADENACKNGHTYTEATIRRNAQGWRECRLCDSARQKRRFDKVKAYPIRIQGSFKK